MTLTRRKMMLTALASGLIGGRAGAEGTQSLGGFAFGGTWRLTLEGTAPVQPQDLRSRIAGILAQIDAQMSPYRAGSDLSRFNAVRSTSPQALPAGLCLVVTEALKVARLTGGAFDPTVGPLVARMGFGPITGGQGTPGDLRATPRTIAKAVPDLTLDLCGIAKGYALDRVIDHLAQAGVTSALVEIGGELRALGHHPAGRPWSVAIADPWTAAAGAWRIVAPGRRALATSGHSHNGVSGRLSTSHIVDPGRGRPAQTGLASVSVLAQTAMRADALATALCAAGPVAGPEMARRLDIPALFIIGTAANPSEAMTGDFHRHVLI